MPARPGPGTYSRPITPSDWWMLSNPGELAMEIQLCVEGHGGIDPAALAGAVATASQACPGARLVRRGRRFVDSGQAPPVRVADAADFDRTRLDSPLLRTPLARNGRASCEVVLVQGTPTTVVFRAHHAMMDGHGAMFWQQQVFRALRGEPVAGAHSRLTEVMEEVAATLGVDLPPAPPPPGLDGLEWRYPLGSVPSGPRGSMWRRRVIDGTHPGVVAKIARQATAFGSRRALVDVPVDLRQFLPGLQTTVMASGKVRILVQEDDGWDDVQASLLTALREHQYLAHRGNPAVLGVPMPRLRKLRLRIDDEVQEERGRHQGEAGVRGGRREHLPPGCRRPGRAVRGRVRGDRVLQPRLGEHRAHDRRVRGGRADRGHAGLAGWPWRGRTR